MAKLLLWICMGVGGALGSLVPALWGSNDLFWSVSLSTVGGLAGIYVWYKLFRYA